MGTLDSVRVRDYMSTKLITFTPETEVMRAVNTLVQHGIAGAPVVNKEGKVVGMFSERTTSASPWWRRRTPASPGR